jgi:hypothetical protein
MSRASVEKRSTAKALPRLERWFQDEIVRPHEGRTAGRPAKSVVLPSRHLSPEERVGIYSEMYFLRLHDCLVEDYPAVRKLLGPPAFERLARAYLKQHPSRHYSLNVLGRKLPEFLDGPLRIPRRAMLADVARVERAISESFDAEVSVPLTPSDLALIPPAAWESGRIRLTESLRLLELGHRANAVVSACRQEKPLPALGRAKTWVLLYRKEWTVWRMDITQSMHAVLAALKAGRPLGRALAEGAKSYAGSPEEMQTEVHRWFREWATEGLFAAVERGRP